MKQYLEAIEIVDELGTPEFIRADITGMTEAQQADIQAAIEDVMKGKSYRLSLHDCGHDEGKGCTMTLLKEY